MFVQTKDEYKDLRTKFLGNKARLTSSNNDGDADDQHSDPFMEEESSQSYESSFEQDLMMDLEKIKSDS